MPTLNIDPFSTGFLSRLVPALAQPTAHFLNRYFPYVEEQLGEFIHYDLMTNKPRLAPLVSPLVEGQVVEQPGYETKTVRPAYSKDKRRFDPNASLRRMAGEKIGGSLDPATRRRALIRQNAEDQLQMLTNREEVMAAEALRTGQTTLRGPGIPLTVVNYRRNAQLTVVLTGGARWSETTATPLANLEAWALRPKTIAGATVFEVTMDPDAWAAFRDRLTDRQIDILLQSQGRGGSAQIDLTPRVPELSAEYMGNIGRFHCWVYSQQFYEVDGTPVEVMPSGSVVMCGRQLMGTRVYGAIRDEEAAEGGLIAQRYFYKSWVTPDPSARWLMMQSAPLVVPVRPDASLGATVL